MKLIKIIYIVYICLDFALTYTHLFPNNHITLEPTDNIYSFIFNSSTITISDDQTKELSFQVKANKGKFIDDTVNYAFINSDSDITSTITFLSTSYSSTDNENDAHDIKYFKITIQSTDSHLIYIKLSISEGLVVITSTIPLANLPDGVEQSNIIGKYKSKTVNFDDYVVIFDVGDFKEGEEMHFKIKAETDSYLANYIYYQYVGGEITFDESKLRYIDYTGKSTFEHVNSISYKTRYFNIKKVSEEFDGTEGNYLLIYFLFSYGQITITNTETDEGKLETWVIIVIVVAVALVIAMSIFCFCWRRKKRLQARLANAATNAAYQQEAANAIYQQEAANAAYAQNVQAIQYQSPPGNYAPGY